jgi:pimeloyl-ACP methyl ester carboxylesterase
MRRHAVALVPGFLGFSHLGRWTYWADRFLAALRAQIEARRENFAPIPVVPVSTLPLGSLAARQRRLVAQLQKLDDQGEGPKVWHLVGHSTGGLDAAYLARKNPLSEGKNGSTFSTETWTNVSIGSVTTVSTPHYGTCLALSEAAELTWQHRLSVSGVKKLTRAGVDALVRPGALSQTRIQFAVASALEGSTTQFLAQLVGNNVLARDLDPAIVANLTGANNRRPDIPIFSIATIAPHPPARQGPPARAGELVETIRGIFSKTPQGIEKDPLFRDLWTFTKERACEARPAPPPVPSVPAVIASDATKVPASIEPEDNDGVVNTDRQFDGVAAGLVLGDHGDVVGLYRRADPLDEKIIEPGLLTSGATFGDNEFFKLMELVATKIASQIS